MRDEHGCQAQTLLGHNGQQQLGAPNNSALPISVIITFLGDRRNAGGAALRLVDNTECEREETTAIGGFRLQLVG
jgi:hypothetical protein